MHAQIVHAPTRIQVFKTSENGNLRKAGTEETRVCSEMSETLKLVERGFAEAFSSGVVQVSGQLVRLCIGEPDGFRLPFYFVAGAAQEVATDPASDETALASIENPTGGVINLFFQQQHPLPWPKGQYTSLSIDWQLGGRYFASEDKDSSSAGVPLLVGDGRLGMLFVTGAYDLDDTNSENVGRFWALARLVGSFSTSQKFTQVFGAPVGAAILSLAIESGIQIENRVSMKLSYYQPLTQAKGTVLTKPLFKFGFEVKQKDKKQQQQEQRAQEDEKKWVTQQQQQKK